MTWPDFESNWGQNGDVALRSKKLRSKAINLESFKGLYFCNLVNFKSSKFES